MSSLATTQVIAEHTQAVVETVHQVAEHAEHAEQAASHGAAHVVNWVTLLAQSLGDSVIAQMLVGGEKIIFAVVVISLIYLFCTKVSARMRVIPDKLQVALESIVEGLDDLVCGVIGPTGREHTPFVGTLFVYILISNLYGLLPLQNSATAYITTTGGLAFLVFCYVQWMGITRNGFKGYLYHLAGSPNDTIGYLFIPLNFPIHVIGEFTKPLSLMFRLYGNVMAGHLLVAVFLGMGLNALRPLGIPFGIPLQVPALFLELLVALIQAFVFGLLSTIYIGMMLPHEQHDPEHEMATEIEHKIVHGEHPAH